MKACLVLVALVVLVNVLEVKGDCDLTGLTQCKGKYEQDLKTSGVDVEKKCEAVEDFQECLEPIDCEVPVTLQPDVDACGAAAISLNIAVILLTSVIAVKNLL